MKKVRAKGAWSIAVEMEPAVPHDRERSEELLAALHVEARQELRRQAASCPGMRPQAFTFLLAADMEIPVEDSDIEKARRTRPQQAHTSAHTPAFVSWFLRRGIPLCLGVHITPPHPN